MMVVISPVVVLHDALLDRPQRLEGDIAAVPVLPASGLAGGLLGLALALQLLLLAPAQPRPAGLGPVDDAARVGDVEDDEGEEHGQGVEDVLVGLVREERVGRRGPRRVLREPVDDAHGDHDQREVHAVEQPAPGQAAVVQTVQQHGAPLLAHQPPVQRHQEADKAQDEELLQADAAHVDVDAQHEHAVRDVGLRGDRCAGRLDEEGQDVEADEERGEALRRQPAQAPGLVKEPQHAAQRHVQEGVDPERRQQEEQLVVGVVVGVVLVFGQQHAEDHRDELPEGAHNDDPAVFLCRSLVLTLLVVGWNSIPFCRQSPARCGRSW